MKLPHISVTLLRWWSFSRIFLFGYFLLRYNFSWYISTHSDGATASIYILPRRRERRGDKAPPTLTRKMQHSSTMMIVTHAAEAYAISLSDDFTAHIFIDAGMRSIYCRFHFAVLRGTPLIIYDAWLLSPPSYFTADKYFRHLPLEHIGASRTHYHVVRLAFSSFSFSVRTTGIDTFQMIEGIQRLNIINSLLLDATEIEPPLAAHYACSTYVIRLRGWAIYLSVSTETRAAWVVPWPAAALVARHDNMLKKQPRFWP